MHHSDRGSQYLSIRYTERLARHDYHLENYTGFVHLACVLILMRAFVR